MNRRHFTKSPSEGPYGVDHLEAPPSPTQTVGGNTILDTNAPAVVPVRRMPEPHPKAHYLIPMMYRHPYRLFGGESVNRGRDRFGSAIAHTMPDRMMAYEQRQNLRRPDLVHPQEVTVG